MRILLIRHAESVDNASGRFAGSRDSPLNSHGVLQARRLAASLAQQVRIAHLFSSPLQRARGTAEIILEAQNEVLPSNVLISKAQELREKDFGSLEGTSYRSQYKRPITAVGETASSLMRRARLFIHESILPLIPTSAASTPDENAVCVVVAHGMILGAMMRALHSQLSQDSKEINTGHDGSQSHASKFPWSNTGYTEIRILEANTLPRRATTYDPTVAREDGYSFQVAIEQVNCTSHLENLRKARGGIGSAAFDDHQQTIDRFFAPATG